MAQIVEHCVPVIDEELLLDLEVEAVRTALTASCSALLNSK
jgi:hypothetical protein